MARIERIEMQQLTVNSATEWVFLVLHCSDGVLGSGEATLYKREQQLREIAARVQARVHGLECADVNRLASLRRSDRLDQPTYAVWSALEQALLDANGQRFALPIHDLLGGRAVDDVGIYANINRSVTQRTPEAFAATASRAVAAGYDAIKIAPFDGLDCKSSDLQHRPPTYTAGLARIDAVRAAIGTHTRLLVDCHWRFDESAARQLIDDVAAHDLYWLECPIPEDEHNVAALKRLRARANERGMRLAGCETMLGVEGFAPFIEGGALDVVMPDVKYAGGLQECRHIARLAEAHGVALSPHNPTGPICHAASLHLAVSIPNCLVLEHQLGESRLFDEIVGHDLPRIVNGRSRAPRGPGLGVKLTLN
ncbi:MAG: mandelate racemase/muconate lactonizing enzyme family protein [Gammaproteobacteria bacterium]